MHEYNETAKQIAEKQDALRRSMPNPNYEPDLVYQDKAFARRPKTGLHAMPNHMGKGLEERRSREYDDLPEGF